MTTGITVRRFSRDENHEMGRIGIFRPEERVELIYGEILAKTPQGTSMLPLLIFSVPGYSGPLGIGSQSAPNSP